MVSRNLTVDVAKGIGIILVVIGHNWSVLHPKGELFRIIFSFHLPLFFFLSGIFLKASNSLSTFLGSRAELLLKPYFIVLTTLGLTQLLWAVLRGTVTIGNVYYWWGLAYSTGKTISWAPLWFLPHLFISSTFALMVVKIVKRKWWITAISILLLVLGIHYIDTFWDQNYIYGTIISISDISVSFGGSAARVPGLPWSFDLLPITTSFLLCGYVVSDLVKTMTFNSIGFVIAVITFSCLHYYFNETIDLNSRIYGIPIISTLQAAMGIYITMSCAALIQRYSILRQPLAYIGSGTLFILMFHDTIQVNIYELLAKIGDRPYVNSSLSLMAGIILPILLGEIANRLKFFSILLFPSK
jgi:polysaccharide biosynthesis protein PslL